MRGMLSAMYCDHANECPNVCPCPANCVCRTHMCSPKADGRLILRAKISGFVLAVSRLLGEDRAVVDLHQTERGARQGMTCGVLEADGTMIFGSQEAERLARQCEGWDAFLDDLRKLMPAASVLGS